MNKVRIGLLFLFTALVGCQLGDNRINGRYASSSSGPLVAVNAPSPTSGDINTSFVFSLTYEIDSTVGLNLSKVQVNTTGDVTCDPPILSMVNSTNPTVTLVNCNGSGTASITLLPGTSTSKAGLADSGSYQSVAATVLNAVSQQIISSSEGGVDFGSSDVGAGPAIQIITITNGNNRDMNDINIIGITNPYDWEGGSFPGTSGTCTNTLASGTSCTIALEFDPATPGEHTIDLTIEYTDGGNSRQEALPVSGYATDNTCPDPIFVGPDHLYSQIYSAQIYAANGDDIILEPGTYIHPFNYFSIVKDIRFYGSTGNPDDVTLEATNGSHYMAVLINAMSGVTRSPGLYHLSVTKTLSGWAPYFHVYGVGDIANHSFTLENLKFTGNLGGNNDLVRSAAAGFTTIINNVDTTTKPYSILHNYNHANAIEVNSLYTQTVPTVNYWDPANLTITNSNFSANPATHGTSQYGAPTFPCGYTPGVVKPARFTITHISEGLNPRISWMKSGNSTSYKIKIKDSNSNVVCTPATTTNQYYDVTGCSLQTGTTYTAEVVAYNGTQLTPASNTMDFTPQATCSGTLLHVGTGQPYTTITAALAAAADGDNLILHPGNHTVPSYTTIAKDIRMYGSTGNPDDVSINVDIGNDGQVFVLRNDLMIPAQVNPGFYHMTLSRNSTGAWLWYFDIQGKAIANDNEVTFENIKFDSAYPIYNIGTSAGVSRIIVKNSSYTSDPGRLAFFDNEATHVQFDNVAHLPSYQGTPNFEMDGNAVIEKLDVNGIVPDDYGTIRYLDRTGSPRFPCGYQP